MTYKVKKNFVCHLQMQPVSPLICYYGDTSCDSEKGSSYGNTDTNSDVLDMEPFVPPKPR